MGQLWREGERREMGGKRFAVLLCAEDSDYVKKMYGGYFGVFVGMLAEEGETWDVYSVACGEFPEDGEIALLDGFVITGSCNDAHGNDVWICQLMNLLKKLDSMKKKVLGICFGHQVCISYFDLLFIQTSNTSIVVCVFFFVNHLQLAVFLPLAFHHTC